MIDTVLTRSSRWLSHISLTRLLVIVLTLVVLATVAAIVVPQHFKTRAALDAHTRDLLDSAINETRENANAFLEQTESIALLTRGMLGAGIVSFEEPEELERYFIEQLALAPQIDAIYFARPDGQFIFTKRDAEQGLPNATITKLIDIKDGKRRVHLIFRDGQKKVRDKYDPKDIYDPRNRPWYVRALQSETAVWTDPYVFFTSQEPGLTVAINVIDQSGAPLGVVGVDIELANLSLFLEHQQKRFEGSALILHRTGGVLAHPGPASLSRLDDDGKFRLATADELSDLTATAVKKQTLKVYSDEDDISFHSFGFEDREYIAVFRPFLNQARWPWQMGIFAPSDQFAATIRTEQQRNLLWAILISTLVVLGALLFGGPLTRPLQVLQKNAEEDPLTGLMNRRAFLQAANEELEDARRLDHPVSALMVDIDHFKEVNDEHGHQVGDEVLTAVAGRLRGALSDRDLISRYGGEEFAVILPNTDLHQAASVAERLNSAFNDRVIETHNVSVAVTVSVGVASLLDLADGIAELLDDADQHLLEAKRSGRNQIVFQDKDTSLTLVQ